ncbi:MAG TPA: VCBS repeat-containing protein, partial [Planctomycetaceae bacterium]|nr:VCBS repeat-containing protein [Planctomycetaceae bacterium]
MSSPESTVSSEPGPRQTPWLAIFLLVMVFLLPLATWLLLPSIPALGRLPEFYSGGTTYPASQLRFERQGALQTGVELPLITNVQILDFDGDGKNDILYCDAGNNRVVLRQLTSDGSTSDQTLIADIAAPAHATPVDIDGDGDLDIVVSVLGNIQPDDGVVGRVELYEQTPEGFVR